MATSNHYINIDGTKIGYKLFTPKKLDKPAPLILFLHGIKKRGNDLSLLDDYGLIRIAEQDDDYKYMVLAPQCPLDTYWSDIRKFTLEILEEVIQSHFVDRNRVFLTGFSMGGHGAWDLAAKTNGVFSAVAPIAGWYDANEAQNLTSIPIWTFHGEEDDVVPISATETIVHAINEVGGKPKFTRYTGIGHEHDVMY